MFEKDTDELFEELKIQPDVEIFLAENYHILAGTKKPSREKLLAISRAMNLNLQETQYLLRYAKFDNLYRAILLILSSFILSNTI